MISSLRRHYLKQFLELRQLDVDQADLLIEERVREPRGLEEGDHELRPIVIGNYSRGYRPARLRVDKIVIENAVAQARLFAWCEVRYGRACLTPVVGGGACGIKGPRCRSRADRRLCPREVLGVRLGGASEIEQPAAQERD